jgi:hypothetical protein
MGRRPGLKSKIKGTTLGSQSPKVQEEIDELLLIFLAAAKTKLQADIDADKFKDLSLKEILSELRGMLRAVQKPATSLQQINLPGAPQAPRLEDNGSPRPIPVKKIASDPESLAKMRERAEKHLDDIGE